jgi:hypothetical protein
MLILRPRRANRRGNRVIDGVLHDASAADHECRRRTTRQVPCIQHPPKEAPLRAISAPYLVATASSAQTPERELRAAEERLATALTKKDAAAFERLLTPDFVFRGAPDLARDAWLKNAVSMCWGERFEISDLAVRSTTTDSALVSLVLTTYQDPVTWQPAVIRSLLTDFWVRGGDGWRLALRHSGPAQDDVAAQFAKVDHVRDFTMKWFADRGMKPADSQANFMFVNIGRPAREFRDACRTKGVVVARDFPPFEKAHCRIAFGTMDEMKKAVAVFGDVLGRKVAAA